ncbi:MAG: FecR domain-containing protein [SAR324 cluster bacterium]|nr:FecR domain-containing protein [SAR324 cluster bacterium]MBL7035209.1 FecR domain-containing protein [SAR324 cluster bacterium]
MFYQIKKQIILLSLAITCFCLLLFQSSAGAVQNSLELHAGRVKLIRNGKSVFLQKVGETYLLQANDRLQTGKGTQISLYLKNRDNTVKLFSHSFFKLDDISAEQNNMALLTGKGNFSVKPLAETSGSGEVKQKTKKEQAVENKANVNFGEKLKGNLAKLTKTKLKRKKKRFNVRTVTAIIGVKGTDFVVATSGDSTNLLALSGEVSLASPEVPDYEIAVVANEVSHVREGSGPSAPVTVSPEERDKIAQADGTASFQEVQFGQSEPVGSIQKRLNNTDAAPVFEEEADAEGELLEQLDRLEELETMVNNAENAIDAATSKTIIIGMTFTNR